MYWLGVASVPLTPLLPFSVFTIGKTADQYLQMIYLHFKPFVIEIAPMVCDCRDGIIFTTPLASFGLLVNNQRYRWNKAFERNAFARDKTALFIFEFYYYYYCCCSNQYSSNKSINVKKLIKEEESGLSGHLTYCSCIGGLCLLS